MAPPDSRDSFVAAGAWLVAFAILLVGIVAVQGFRGSVSGVAPVSSEGRELKPNSSGVRVSGAAIDVLNVQAGKATLLQLPVAPFRAADRGRLRLEAAPVPANAEVAFVWARAAEPGKIHEQRLPLDGDRVVMTMLLDDHPGWRGEIAVVALAVRGIADTPWRVTRVTLDAAGARAVARGIVDDWSSYGAWDGRSINVAFGGRETQRAWLPLLSFVAALAACAFLRLRARRRGGSLVPAAAVLPFIVAWLVTDFRWAAELTDKAQDTFARFAGKSLAERHLAMEDGDLYWMTERAKGYLPDASARIFVGSDFEYFRMRAAYHLYPHNVLPFGWWDGKVMRAGDYVFLYQKADVRFDATNSALIWPDGSRSPVVPLVARSGAGLFRIQ
ncbi:MAG: hypothetical protein ABIX11_15415 [Casimicrobiaceae bacterium]